MKDKVHEELKRHFRPEFLNRIDDVIVFHELTTRRDHRDRRPADQAGAGPAREPGPRLRAHARRRSCCSPTKGYDPALGARPLRRAIQRMVEDPLSEKILWKEFHAGETIVVDAEGDEIVFRTIEGVEPPPVELAGKRSRTEALEALAIRTLASRRSGDNRSSSRPTQVGAACARGGVSIACRAAVRGLPGRRRRRCDTGEDGVGHGHRPCTLDRGGRAPRRARAAGRSSTAVPLADLRAAGWQVSRVDAATPTAPRRSRLTHESSATGRIWREAHRPASGRRRSCRTCT